MADSIVGGLFGMTPESYQDTRQLLEQRQALQQAQLDPYEAVNYMAARAGQQLGRGIGGLLGAEDPQLQRISQFQNLAGQADLTTPEGYINFGKQLMSVDPQRGALAIQRGQQMAQDINKQLTEATLKSAQSQKAMAEAQKIELDFNDEKVAKETAKKALQAQNVDPTQIDAIVNNKDARTSFLKQVTDKTDTVEANGRVLLINKQNGQTIADLGVAPERGTKLSVDARQGQQISKNKTDLAGEIEKDAFTASDRITLAQNLRSLLPRAFTGVGSDVVLQGARVAEAFGIDVKGVAPSQIVDTILNEMTIGKAGELKGALSDKDREFLKATIGTRGLSIKTLNFVADEIERRASIDRKLNTRVNDFVKSKKNLNEIDFAEERSQAKKDVEKDLARLNELRQKAGQQ
jgi:NACalpha-BTF3-like transcription factor